MKRLFICLIPLLLYALHGFSQNTIRDSLLNEIKTTPEDSAKAVTYLHYGGLFEQSNPDSAQFYYDKSWKLAERLNYKSAMAMNISYQIAILNNKGRFREALRLCEQAVEIYKELKSDRDIAIATNNVGNEQQYLGELRHAIDNYLKAINIAEKLKDSALIRLFTNNVASVFVTLKEFDRGKQYANESYEVALRLKDTFGMATSLVNLALAEAGVNDYQQSREHLNKVIELGNYLDDYTLVLDGYNNIGSIYNSLKQYEGAEQQFKTALEIARKYDNPAYELVSLQGLTDTYFAQKEHELADATARRAIDVAEATGSRHELRDLYLRASEIKERTGNLQASLNLRKKYESLHDTLLNEQVRNNINQLEMQYSTARKDRAIAEQKLILERNKVAIQRKNVQLAWSLGIALVLAIIFVASYLFYRQKQRFNAQRILSLQKEQEVIRLKAVLEGQDAERQRISKEMHDDVGSGLTSILYLTQNLSAGTVDDQTTVVPKITRTANNLVEKMNEIIWSLNKKFDTLEDLVIYIRHSISELLDDRDMDYRFRVPDDIPPIELSGEQRRNIYLVVKEAVHNAIKHSGATLITIDFSFDKDFSVSVHDNGKGIDVEALRRFGNGLGNMKQRMETIGGDLEITSGNGTTVRARLPLTV